MTTTPTEQADLRSMVAPGQEGIFDEFLAELEQQDAAIAQAEGQQSTSEPRQEEQPRLLAGKFKTQEELERGYLEAQKLLSSRGQKPAEPEPSPAPLSRDQAVEHYGDSIVTAAEEAGIDLGAWDQAVRRGDDTGELRQKLSQQTGIPAQLIEQYEAAFRPQGNSPAAKEGSTQGLSDADVAELKGFVGGEEEFQRLSQWAVANLDAGELADYNSAVDSGNKAAIKFALRAMQARAGKPQGEPELIGGGRAPKQDVFETQEQALEAMRKTNSNGKRLYNVDPKYKDWFEKTLARSNFTA
jgi:hypothetical protein